MNDKELYSIQLYGIPLKPTGKEVQLKMPKLKQPPKDKRPIIWKSPIS